MLKKILSCSLLLISAAQLSAKPIAVNQEMINDAFTCKATFKDAMKVASSLKQISQASEMSDEEVDKIGLPQYAVKFPMQITVLGYKTPYSTGTVNSHLSGMGVLPETLELITFLPTQTSKESLEKTTKIAAENHLQPDTEFNQSMKLAHILQASFSEKTTNGQTKRTLSVSNFYGRKNTGNLPVVISCSYEDHSQIKKD